MNGAETLKKISSSRVFRLWLKKSFVLLLGTLMYNLFVLLIIQPILQKWFPALTPWEKVKQVVIGSSRTTYSDLLPYIGPTVWITGNAFLFALLNRNLQEARSSVQENKRQRR